MQQNVCHKMRVCSALLSALVLLLVYADTSAQTTAPGQNTIVRTSTMTDQKKSNIGRKFPEVSAESLAGTKVSIPESARGNVTLVTVAFLRESQSQLDSWLGPFEQKFGGSEGYTFYEIPMIASGYKFMRFIIDGGMRGGIPQYKHKNVVTMYGDVEKYMDALHLDPRYGYAFLLDREGIIRFQGQGASTPETLKELFAMAGQLAKK